MKNKYVIIIIIGLLLWVSETAFFGWNQKPESVAETIFDLISAILIGWGVVGDILSNLEIHKHSHFLDKSVHNITTNKVEVKGKPVVHYNFGTTKEETADLLKKVNKSE